MICVAVQAAQFQLPSNEMKEMLFERIISEKNSTSANNHK